MAYKPYSEDDENNLKEAALKSMLDPLGQQKITSSSNYPENGILSYENEKGQTQELNPKESVNQLPIGGVVLGGVLGGGSGAALGTQLGVLGQRYFSNQPLNQLKKLSPEDLMSMGMASGGIKSLSKFPNPLLEEYIKSVKENPQWFKSSQDAEEAAKASQYLQDSIKKSSEKEIPKFQKTVKIMNPEPETKPIIDPIKQQTYDNLKKLGVPEEHFYELEKDYEPRVSDQDFEKYKNIFQKVKEKNINRHPIELVANAQGIFRDMNRELPSQIDQLKNLSPKQKTSREVYRDILDAHSYLNKVDLGDEYMNQVLKTLPKEHIKSFLDFKKLME